MINGYANSNNKNTYKGSSRTPAFVLLAYPTYCSPFFIGNDMVDKKEYYKQWYERNRECRIEYARKWSAENKKQVKKNRKQWYERNKEKQKEYSKKWYTENKERVKGNTRRWQKENKDKFEEWRRKWDKKNPEKRKIMGEIGYKRIKEKLSWEHQKENLYNAYRLLFNK